MAASVEAAAAALAVTSLSIGVRNWSRRSAVRSVCGRLGSPGGCGGPP